MAGILNNIQPTERRSLRVAGTGATVAGTTNTQVIAFTGVPTLVQGTVFALSLTQVAPSGGTGVWVNAVNDAVFGTTFKMLKRGQFRAQISAIGTAGSTVAAQIGITIDSPAANLIATTGLTDATVGLIDYSQLLGVAVASLPLKAQGIVNITDTLATPTALPAAAAGAQGQGVIRFHASTGAGAVIAAALIITTIRCEIDYIGDLAG